MPQRCVWILLGVVALAVIVSPVGLAQTPPRLPQDYPIARGEGSPGQVTFSHQSHVDLRKPDCTACHPSLFKILVKGTPADGGPMGHAAMERGRQCGACHNGKTTFGLDNCALCHREG
jgi:c(7)-type cytochrome triheme protein